VSTRRGAERRARCAGTGCCRLHPASALPVHLAEDPGIDDALIQPYSGHASRQSLEIYSRVAIANAQQAYDQTIGRFPV
jgi:hypothetical protein